MTEKRNTIFAWLFFGLITASVIAAIIYDFSTRPADDRMLPAEVLISFVPVSFAVVGALIISRQPRNKIGWLMMGPGISMFILTDAVMRPFVVAQLPPPENPSTLFLLTLWFSNWNWLLIVFPLMFTMVIFPSGRPLNARWGWLNYFGAGLMIFLIFWVTFAKEVTYGSGGADWTLPNPIGFIPTEWEEPIVTPFLLVLPLWVILCFAALLVRFRRAIGVERQQIKWLLYAGAVFALFYVPSFIQDDWGNADLILNFLFVIGLPAFPIAIAIAILRYRLFDIDVIIRRTLQYTILTGLLALMYFGGIVILQGILGSVTSELNSPLITVITTLGIAAIFNPLRFRVQSFIDRRFFRQKYDAEQALANYAAIARDEVDMDKLSAALLGVVEETMQPERVSLWLTPAKK